jgi:uracil-DNA glycosylase
MNKQQRAEKLKSLARGIVRSRKCRLHESRTHAVPGEGDPHAKVMRIGEAPGEKEDAQGRPFVGPSGDFLDKLARQEATVAQEIVHYISPDSSDVACDPAYFWHRPASYPRRPGARCHLPPTPTEEPILTITLHAPLGR